MHNPLDETHRASCLRENLTSSSYGEGLETDRATTQVPRQSLTRQLKYDGFRALAVIEDGPRSTDFSQRAIRSLDVRHVIRACLTGNTDEKEKRGPSLTCSSSLGF